MFGLHEITWKEFLLFNVGLILAWDAVLLLWFWFRSQNRPILPYEGHAEEGGETPSKTMDPIFVSSASLPSELLAAAFEDAVPLEVSLYEETGPDDGILVDYLLNEKNGKLEKLLSCTHY